MYIYNSVSKKKELFKSQEEKIVRIYVCGPTVYDDSHLGHARSALVFDLLRRTLQELKYKVIFAKNFTDIDDKIIKKMKESNQSLETITTQYIQRYKDDMNALNIKDADIEPKATDNIQNIINFIQTLIEKDFAYVIDNGVYFEVNKDKEYFSLSHRDVEDDQNINRVENSIQKRDPKDFALWKLSKKDELSYQSPWGDGRPGWHIECSAMIKEHLATTHEYQIDIHGGGADLLFPHHENEASQSRCHSNQQLAKYWMHNGFVQINGTKMSKSLGNSFFLKDALENYNGEVLRFYLLSSHYRSNFSFNEEDLLSSKKRLDKLYRLKKRINIDKGSAVNKIFKKKLLEKLEDDLNISEALSVIDAMVSNANEKLDKEPKNKSIKKEIRSNISFIENLLGIGLIDPYKYFQIGISKEEISKIEEFIAQRDEAKKAKDYTLADQIRNIMLEKNISIMDTPNGTVWEKGTT